MAEPAETMQDWPQAGMLAATEAHCVCAATEDTRASPRAAMMAKNFMVEK